MRIQGETKVIATAVIHASDEEEISDDENAESAETETSEEPEESAESVNE